MTYGDLQNMVQTINTGSSNPSYLANFTKLILGKIARRKVRQSFATITTSGSTEINLKTALPDFISFKTDPENNDRCIYYFEGSNEYPIFFRLSNNSRYAQNVGGGRATIIGNTLKLSIPTGDTIPATIYFPYFSKYLVLDDDGSTEKEQPADSGDTFLIDSVFDDLLVDGLMMYISRREKDNKEFNKNVREWESRLNDIMLYS